MKKKLFIGVMLALLALFAAMPCFAATVVDSGSCGDNLTWELDSDGTLAISGTGEMWDFIVDTSYGWDNWITPIPWKKHQTDITTLVVNEGVTSIGINSFDDCSALKSVTLPESLEKIGDEAFCECTSLTYVDIPSNVNVIGNNPFIGCSSLVKIAVSSDNTSYCSSDDILFDKNFEVLVSYPPAKTWTSYPIPDGIKEIAWGAFGRCSNLTNISIPDSVTKINGYAFFECTRLYEIDIPSSVKLIDELAFNNCTNLKEVNLSDGIQRIGRAVFGGCSAIENIVLPDTITKIDASIFYACTNLQSAQLSNNITEIPAEAFAECSALKNISLPDGITIINFDAFSSCSSLETIDMPSALKYIGGSAFYECKALTAIDIPNGTEYIGSLAFLFCENLRTINIPDSVIIIEGYDTFYGTAWFKHLPDGEIYINRVYYGYKGTPEENSSIHIKDGTVSMSGSDSAFGNYDVSHNVSEVTIPDSVIIIGDMSKEADIYCKNMPEGPKYINNVLYEGYIGSEENVKIKEGTVSISKHAFSTYWGDPITGLVSVDIPDSVKFIGDRAFYYCEDLTTVNIPKSLEYIGDSAFAKTNISEISIPNGVHMIGNYTFNDCKNLTTINLPTSIKYIGFSAFGLSENITNVYYDGTEQQWNEICIDNSGDYNAPLLNATIHFNSTLPKEEAPTFEITYSGNTATVKNISDTTQLAYIAIASYTNEGRLKDITEFTETFIGKNKTKSYTIPTNGKIFVFDFMEGASLF